MILGRTGARQPTARWLPPTASVFAMAMSICLATSGNWYGLGGTEIPVTQPEPFDYQVLGALMKVW
jgi:hypothetical protein